MSLSITKSLRRPLAIAAAVLLVHAGRAAAASPQSDIQQQVMDFLTGNVAIHSIPRAEQPGREASRSSLDAQEFARRLLLGWSISRVGDSQSRKQSLSPAASNDSEQGSPEQGDAQAAMRRVLLGEHS